MSEDFGFYFEDTADVKELEGSKEAAIEAAKHLYNRINTLLIKLEENPEKTTINWPNRSKHIAAFRAELLDVLQGAGIMQTTESR